MFSKGLIAKSIRANMRTYTMILALLSFWILFGALTIQYDPSAGIQWGYLSAQNLSNLFRQMTVTSFLSCGMVLVIVTGGIDLSVGKVAGFVSVIAAALQAYVWNNLFPNAGLTSAALTVLCALAVGTFIGAAQGAVIAYLRVPAFIVTLGGMWIFNGGILIVTQGRTIPANQPAFSVIGQGYLPVFAGWVIAAVVVVALFLLMISGRNKKRRYGIDLAPLGMDIAKTTFYSLLVVVYVVIVNRYQGMQIPVLLLAVVAIVMSYLTNNTRFGRYAYALGGNMEAARLSGINIKKNIFLIFVLMGFLCGVSGISLASYVGYGTISAGQGYELDAIAACILGGTSTLGGEGTVIGAMVGSLIMASLTNGLQMLNVAPAWQYILKGVVLVIAVWADVAFKKSSK